MFSQNSATYSYNSTSVLGKYQVAFSTDAPNGNFNKITSQERKKHQRDKNRQNARKKRGVEKNYAGEQKIYLGSPEFELLKKDYINLRFSKYIATNCQYQCRCFSESFPTEYRNSDRDQSRFADEIKDILSTCITTLYERLLFQARGEYVPVDDFSWFEQVTEAEMQNIVNQLFEFGYGDMPKYWCLHATIQCIKHVQENPSILEKYVPHDTRPFEVRHRFSKYEAYKSMHLNKRS